MEEKAILERIEERLISLENRGRQRRKTLTAIFLAVVLLIGTAALLLAPKIGVFLDDCGSIVRLVGQVSDTVESVDFEALKISTETISKDLDPEQLNRQLESLAAFAAKFSELDIDKLNDTIDTANTTVESIKSLVDALSEKLPKMTGLFKKG